MGILSTRSYSPKEVFVLVGVVPVLTFNRVVVQYDRPRWAFYEGTQGEESRGKRLSAMGTISIEMPRTTLFNDALSGMYALHGVLPVVIKDLQGLAIHMMPKGTIIDMPGTAYEKEVTENTWVMKGSLFLNVNAGSNEIIGGITGNVIT